MWCRIAPHYAMDGAVLPHTLLWMGSCCPMLCLDGVMMPHSLLWMGSYCPILCYGWCPIAPYSAMDEVVLHHTMPRMKPYCLILRYGWVLLPHDMLGWSLSPHTLIWIGSYRPMLCYGLGRIAPYSTMYGVALPHTMLWIKRKHSAIWCYTFNLHRRPRMFHHRSVSTLYWINTNNHNPLPALACIQSVLKPCKIYLY